MYLHFDSAINALKGLRGACGDNFSKYHIKKVISLLELEFTQFHSMHKWFRLQSKTLKSFTKKTLIPEDLDMPALKKLFRDVSIAEISRALKIDEATCKLNQSLPTSARSICKCRCKAWQTWGASSQCCVPSWCFSAARCQGNEDAAAEYSYVGRTRYQKKVSMLLFLYPLELFSAGKKAQVEKETSAPAKKKSRSIGSASLTTELLPQPALESTSYTQEQHAAFLNLYIDLNSANAESKIAEILTRTLTSEAASERFSSW